jgi:hypothetical protein
MTVESVRNELMIFFHLSYTCPEFKDISKNKRLVKAAQSDSKYQSELFSLYNILYSFSGNCCFDSATIFNYVAKLNCINTNSEFKIIDIRNSRICDKNSQLLRNVYFRNSYHMLGLRDADGHRLQLQCSLDFQLGLPVEQNFRLFPAVDPATLV